MVCMVCEGRSLTLKATILEHEDGETTELRDWECSEFEELVQHAAMAWRSVKKQKESVYRLLRAMEDGVPLDQATVFSVLEGVLEELRPGGTVNRFVSEMRQTFDLLVSEDEDDENE